MGKRRADESPKAWAPRDDFLWTSESDELGWCYALPAGRGVAVAVRVAMGPSAPVIQEVRIFPAALLEEMSRTRGPHRFRDVDASFWRDNSEEDDEDLEQTVGRAHFNHVDLTPTAIRRIDWVEVFSPAWLDYTDNAEAFGYSRETAAVFAEVFGYAADVAAVYSDPAIEQPRRPGRRGNDDSFYAVRAAAYLTEVRAGNPAPLDAIAEAFHCSRSTAAGWMTAARKRGLLTALGPGRMGGHLTDRAQVLLNEGLEGRDG